MKKILSIVIIAVLMLSTFSILSPQVKSSSGVAPKVVCVPFHGELAGVPHDAWIGKEIILKGTAHDEDGDSTMVAYKWDFGDGYSTDWISGVNPYITEAKHTYTGTMADGTPYGVGKYFTAWLHVRDADGLVGQDSYFIGIRDKTLDVEVNVAIDDGLWWLHKQAYRYTSGGIDYARWSSYSSYYTSATAESVLAFEIQGHQPIGNPDENPYVETVQRGLNYVFSRTRVVDIGAWGPGTSSPYGDPDTNGNDVGIGISSGQEVYELGMVMMAIAASGDPDLTADTGPTGVVGRTYKDILTDMVDICAWGQNDYGGARGGWRYAWNYGSSDNSVSQWPVMALEAAETNWGIMVADFVKTELDTYWLTYSQRADGGFGYNYPGTSNIARTGTGIIGLNYVGLPADNTRIVSAVNWLGNHWSEFGNYYGMYAVMKAMRTAHPEITMVGSHDWYAEYARYLVDNQQADDGWPNYYGRVLATDWAILILTPTVTEPGPVADAGSDVENHPPEPVTVKFDASGSYHVDPTKTIVSYEWDFESDGTWDYSFGRFVYPKGLVPTAPNGKQSYGYDGACTYYNYAGWLARGDKGHYLSGRYHLGQDMEADVGDNVYAITDGVVAYISYTNWGSGNLGIVLRHKLSDGTEFLALYGHVRSAVSISDNIASGESFAIIGPYDTIPHLHFGIHPGLTIPPTNWGSMPLSSWPDPNAYPGDPNGPDTNGFVDPIEWINTRTPLNSVPLYFEHAYPAYYNPDGSIDWSATAKDYTSTLRVTDNSDPPLQDTDIRVVHITSPPWKPVSDPDGPYEGFAGYPLQLTGADSYDPESRMYPPDHPWYETIEEYEWDLDNDGQFDDSTEMNPTYTWETKGTYSIGLKVTDSDPSGPGGTIGPLDVDIKYVTVVIEEATARVTVTIVEVRAIDPPTVPFILAQVSIDGQFTTRTDFFRPDFYPEWTFSHIVSKTVVPIHVEIWGRDPNFDYQADIDKDTDDLDLDLSFDITDQSLSGDVTYGYSKGEGDGGRLEVWFNVGLDTGDRDGDGLFDSWETDGIHMDDDGVVDLTPDLDGDGIADLDPEHKDLLIEIDWMEDASHSHRPTDEAINNVTDSFDKAPVSNPDGTTGINLWIDRSNNIGHNPVPLGAPFGLNIWGDFDTIKAANFDPSRRFVYHYCLFVHSLSDLNDGDDEWPSGIAELPGNDFIVALGDYSAMVPPPLFRVRQEAGTLMHELGHNLNLHHGGDTPWDNYKPNYLSVMNYRFQFTGILGRQFSDTLPPIDYSRIALPDLNESNLNENLGIQDGADNTAYYTPAGAWRVGQGFGPIDWDGDGIIENSVQADINTDPPSAPFGIIIPWYTVLTGYDDWANIRLNVRGMTADFADGVHENFVVEADVETLKSQGPTEVIQKFAEGPVAVSLHTEESWDFTYMVTNTYDYEIYNLTVKDHFGANLDVAFLSSTRGTYTQYTNKPGRQQRFTWIIENLAPFETVTLKLEVSTGLNPAKKQQFTSAGLKILNSGATVKWVNASGHQGSAESGQISIWAGVSVSDTTGAIAGYVTNAITEEPLRGYVVELQDSTGTLVATTTTDKNGFYAFSSLAPTDYTVICSTQSYTTTVTAEQVKRIDFELD